jgi:hypothetical protein
MSGRQFLRDDRIASEGTLKDELCDSEICLSDLIRELFEG